MSETPKPDPQDTLEKLLSDRVTVTLIGSNQYLLHHMFRASMAKEGHFIDWTFLDLKDFDDQLPQMTKEELGVVVVTGKVPPEYRLGDPNTGSHTRNIPMTIRRYFDDVPTILAFHRPLNPEELAIAEREYDLVVPYEAGKIADNAARAVTQLATELELIS